MTLVITKKEGSKIYILADTQITPPEHLDDKPFDALKVFFLNKTTAIAYSGLTQVAHEIIFNAYNNYNTTPDFELLTDEIRKSREREEDPPDFLLLNLSVDSIIKVSDIGVSRINSGIAWVGDADAANFVSQNYQMGSIYGLKNALDTAIDNHKYITVGGYSVLAEGKEDGFKFLAYLKLISPGYKPSPVGQTVDFGTAETGGFGFTTVAPKRTGDNGYGIYFFQGKFGYFFHVDIQNNIAERLRVGANSIEEFVRTVELEIHTPLEYCGSLG